MGAATFVNGDCCVDSSNHRKPLVENIKPDEDDHPTLSPIEVPDDDHEPQEFIECIREVVDNTDANKSETPEMKCPDILEDIETEFTSESLAELRDSFHRDRNKNPLSTTHSMHDVSHLYSPASLKPHVSVAVTAGNFCSVIMRKIEHGNNLNLSKIEMKKENVGRGTSALVHLAMYNNREIALKEYKFNDTDFNFTNLSEFQNELYILQELDHTNVIHFYGYHLNVHKKVLKVAFEFCPNGTLFDLIHPLLVQSPYQYKDMIHMLLDIANGMQYMHSRHIINRDLKPRNLLLFDNYHVKITDFGASVLADCEKVDDCESFEEFKLTEPIGTNGYKAPEVVRVDVKKGYNYKIDVFSFGCICYELWTKQFVSGIQYLTRYEHLKED
eukprot:524818_1